MAVLKSPQPPFTKGGLLVNPIYEVRAYW
jgi:hypothetical protein